MFLKAIQFLSYFDKQVSESIVCVTCTLLTGKPLSCVVTMCTLVEHVKEGRKAVHL